MRFGFIKRLDWKYLFGEILLIFLGIQLSLAFSGYIEDQKKKKEEIAILTEIKDNLSSDLDDIGPYLRFKARLVTADSSLLVHLRAGHSYDSISRQMSYCFAEFGWVEQDRSGYEAAKSYDIGIISNDSVRRKVTQYYEVFATEMRSVMNDGETIRDEGLRLLSNYYEEYPYVPGETSVAHDRNGLLKDLRLRFYISQMLGYNETTLDYFRHVNRVVVELKEMIEKEIKRLD
jgi:hypothetical protein